MLNVHPQKDLAVGIEPTEVACNDCFGSVEAGAPAKLYLFDLIDNTFKIIYTNNQYLIGSVLLSPDATKIFFTETASDAEVILYSINLDGSDKKEIGRDVKIAAMSSNADRLILIPSSSNSTSNSYQILNVETGDAKNFELADYDEAYLRFMTCNYPLGFNCLYQQL
ncbi:MAG: hypothetical protein ACD_80C00081G0001 [uncultured bacterium (gcode 4)]|uniref:Uncharacterized protein n=1 Tax=uncultured bacterium (gcode 4) TaxID=1234023 RepID=K1XJG9_9BACT|nr:MAG: hypothetical protein ACD_80C00081G0001 [uncultured bacterium (gcode 4)]